MEITKQEITANQNRNKALNDRLKNSIKSKEKQIKNIEQTYNSKIDQTKAYNEQRLSDTNLESTQKVIEALDNRKEKLNEIKKQIEVDNMRLGKERDFIKNKNDNIIENLKQAQENRYRIVMQNAEDNVGDITERNQYVLGNLQEQSNSEIGILQNDLNLEKEIISNQNENIINDIEKNYEMKKNTRLKMQDASERQAQKSFKKSLKGQENSHNIILKDRKSAQDKERLEQEKNHHITMQEREKNFRANFKQLKANHEVFINNLQSKFDKELKDLRSQHTILKNNIVNKTDDDFYKVVAIDPFIQDFGDFYQVSIEVPEHEQGNVRVTADNRTLNIFITRSYKGTSEDVYGDTNKVTRSETYTKSIQLEDILDKAKIAQKYENGALQFRIAKL